MNELVGISCLPPLQRYLELRLVNSISDYLENLLFEKILFPTDLSGYAIKSLDCIAALPGTRGIILLHVVDGTTYSKRGGTHEKEIENSRLFLEQHKKDLEALNLKVRVLVNVITSGNVSHRILEVASAEKVDLIVLGARGRSMVQGPLLGSVSSAVLHNLIIMF